MAVGDIFRVTIVGSLHSQVINTVLHYRQEFDSGISTTPEVGLAAQVNVIAQNLLAEQSAEFAYQFTMAQYILAAPPRNPVVDLSGAGVGSIAGDSLPAYCCATITKQTVFAGRRYRGRIFMAGIPVTSELDSQLKAARKTAIQTIANQFAALQTDANGDQFRPILLHRNPFPINYTNLKAMRVNSVLRSQRRREVGKGV